MEDKQGYCTVHNCFYLSNPGFSEGTDYCRGACRSLSGKEWYDRMLGLLKEKYYCPNAEKKC